MTDVWGGKRLATILVMIITSAHHGFAQSTFLNAVDSVQLIAFHRMFTNYTESITAKPESTFSIGDENYTGKVTDFLPYFQIDSAGQVTSRSDSLGNPAAKVVVFKDGKAVDSSWAFQGQGPPHYARTSMFGFRMDSLYLKPDSTRVEHKGE
jgi:hypothetical protein